MKYGLDFTVEPLAKRSHGNRQRVKPFYTKEAIIDSNVKNFKNFQQIRSYWAERKRKQRAKK